jgi:hypothetical protein
MASAPYLSAKASTALLLRMFIRNLAHVLGVASSQSMHPAALLQRSSRQHAVWFYARFTLSYRDREDLLAEHVFYETLRELTARSWPQRGRDFIATWSAQSRFAWPRKA